MQVGVTVRTGMHSQSLIVPLPKIHLPAKFHKNHLLSESSCVQTNQQGGKHNLLGGAEEKHPDQYR